MRCQDCKTCLSAIKKGHIECMKTFNYKKSKVIEAAATHQQRNIYNFLKTFGCPRSLDVEVELCAKNQWLEEYYSFFRSWPPSYEAKLSLIRSMTHAALKYGDVSMLNGVYSYEPYGTRVRTQTSTFHDAFSGVHMFAAMINAIKSADTGKIERIYEIFWERSNEWSPTDFRDAIWTGSDDVLAKVIEMWKGFRGRVVSYQTTGRATNQLKLLTIKHNNINMLKMLDREISGYPSGMMHEMRHTRGHSTQARREMIAYVWGRRTPRINASRRDYTASLATGIVERERIEQRQATAAPVAPVREKVTNLQKALGIIEDCELPEGKYLELCNILMDVHRRGVC